MAGLSEIVGLFVALAIIIAVIVWLVWLTRRPSRPCPECDRQIPLRASQCPVCGAAVEPQDEQTPAGPRVSR